MSRAPGFFEKHFFLRNSLGFYTNLSTTAKYNRHVDRTHLAAALQLMISENPWFCTNFFKVNNTGDVYKDYELRPVDEIKFDSVVGFSKIKKFDADTIEYTNSLRVPIGKKDAPLWRLIVLETDTEQYFTFYACHSNFDGGSTAQFHKDLLSYLGRTDSANFEDILYRNHGDTPILPPVEDLDLFRPLLLQKIWLYLEVKAPKLFSWLKWIASGFPETFEIFQASPISDKIENKFRVINVPSADLNKLVSHCRSQSHTLTPYLTAIVKTSLEKYVYPQYYSDPSTVGTRLLMAMEGRRYSPELSNPFRYGPVVCAQVWDMAPGKSIKDNLRLVHENTQKSLKSQYDFKHTWTFKLIDTEKTLSKSIGTKMRITLLMTNIGMIKEVPDQDWQIIDAWFALNNTFFYHFTLHAISTPQGGLNICLGYLPEYDELETIDNEKSVSVMDAVERDIKAMISKSISE